MNGALRAFWREQNKSIHGECCEIVKFSGNNAYIDGKWHTMIKTIRKLAT
jgi:hypothetical protein